MPKHMFNQIMLANGECMVREIGSILTNRKLEELSKAMVDWSNKELKQDLIKGKKSLTNSYIGNSVYTYKKTNIGCYIRTFDQTIVYNIKLGI